MPVCVRSLFANVFGALQVKFTAGNVVNSKPAALVLAVPEQQTVFTARW